MIGNKEGGTDDRRRATSFSEHRISTSGEEEVRCNPECCVSRGSRSDSEWEMRLLERLLESGYGGAHWGGESSHSLSLRRLALLPHSSSLPLPPSGAFLSGIIPSFSFLLSVFLACLLFFPIRLAFKVV